MIIKRECYCNYGNVNVLEIWMLCNGLNRNRMVNDTN